MSCSLAACCNEPTRSTHEAPPAAETTIEPEVTPESASEPFVDEAASALDLNDAQWELSADGS